MNNYDDHLQFTRNVVQRTELPKSICNELNQLINRIQKRKDDPNLYLAVIGEFSSGKSTFINALLRDDLLKTSALVTTATATRIHSGKEIVVQAQFTSSEKADKHRQFLIKNNNIKNLSKDNAMEVYSASLISSDEMVLLGLMIVCVVTVLITLFFMPVVKHIFKNNQEYFWIPYLLVSIYTIFKRSFLSSAKILLKNFYELLIKIWNYKKLINKPKTKIKQPNKSFLITSQELKIDRLELKQFIEQLTSNEEIAQDVVSVTISHSSTFLTNNIVIIDLPGTNAENTRHAAVAKNVIENEADLAIIITPATQLFTQSLLNFLSTTIGDYLHRCIFMVTRMDEIRPPKQKEYDRIFKYAKQKVNSLNIDNPKIYSCSAQMIIDELNGVKESGKNAEDWITQFNQIQKEIIEHLYSEREATINNSIQRVFNQLFDNLDRYLKQNWHDYHVKQELLEKETIPDLKSFAATQHRECERMIERSYVQIESQIYNCINSHQNNITSKIKSAIFNASDWDELKSVLNYTVESILRDDQRSLSSEIQNKCDMLRQAAIEAGNYFDQKFTEVYRRLQALGGQVDTTSVSRAINITINTASVVYSAQEMNQQNMGNAMKGLFSRVFKGVLDDRKNKVWQAIYSQLNNYFGTAQQQAKQSLKSQSLGVTQAINRRIDNYIDHYQIIIKDMLEDQERELTKLISLQETIQQDLTEIARRRDSMIT